VEALPHLGLQGVQEEERHRGPTEGGHHEGTTETAEGKDPFSNNICSTFPVPTLNRI